MMQRKRPKKRDSLVNDYLVLFIIGVFILVVQIGWFPF